MEEWMDTDRWMDVRIDLYGLGTLLVPCFTFLEISNILPAFLGGLENSLDKWIDGWVDGMDDWMVGCTSI
jgi:hypothetical protein